MHWVSLQFIKKENYMSMVLLEFPFWNAQQNGHYSVDFTGLKQGSVCPKCSTEFQYNKREKNFFASYSSALYNSIISSSEDISLCDSFPFFSWIFHKASSLKGC